MKSNSPQPTSQEIGHQLKNIHWQTWTFTIGLIIALLSTGLNTLLIIGCILMTIPLTQTQQKKVTPNA